MDTAYQRGVQVNEVTYCQTSSQGGRHYHQRPCCCLCSSEADVKRAATAPGTKEVNDAWLSRHVFRKDGDLHTDKHTQRAATQSCY